MNNAIYSRTLVPANESPDGEATILEVTEESNGNAVFIVGPNGTVLLKWFQWSRNQAIEFGVAYDHSKALAVQS